MGEVGICWGGWMSERVCGNGFGTLEEGGGIERK